ncbi:hypothetical protein AAFN88_06975 [Pelagibius sp. CAU 1746]|uniref:hypothetical protein n=1 Tax=Pelagibius sp. CAU 1746 TaxID=3140370 RepID=UPI00325AC09B
MSTSIDYEQALLNPAAVFKTPESVLTEDRLSKAQKIEILRRWEYDASEDAVAEEEGMQAEHPLMLRRVLLALEELTGSRGAAHAAPTKQNG